MVDIEKGECQYRVAGWVSEIIKLTDINLIELTFIINRYRIICLKDLSVNSSELLKEVFEMLWKYCKSSNIVKIPNIVWFIKIFNIITIVY